MPTSRSLVGLIVAAAGCSSRPPPGPCVAATVDHLEPIAVGSGFAAQQYWSSESAPFDVDDPDPAWFQCPRPIAHAFERGPDLPITAVGGAAATTINVDPGVRYQAILGTGISMEEASVANLRLLSPGKRLELLSRMFDPAHGMGLDLVRVTMGTSDFTGRAWYTYDDVPAGDRDPTLARFSIQPDVDAGIVDVLRQILAINPDVKFFASPWSPPAWMKTGARITGGALISSDIPALAVYFRRFVEAYRDLGIPIYAVTLQNEPRTQSPDMPTCLVDAGQEAALAKAVAHELAAAGLATKVWIYDHNFDAALDYANDVFADGDARAVIAGVALHDYAGDPAAMTAVHERYPEQDLVFTEKTLWGTAGVDRAAQYFRNWSTSYVSWLTMLDQHGLPNNGPNSDKPRRFMRSIEYAGDEYYATPEHYLFGLYSRLVQRGARRIDSDYGDPAAVTDVAFANPDGSIVAIVINQTDVPQALVLRSEGNQIRAVLDAKTAAGYLWRGGLGPSPLAPE